MARIATVAGASFRLRWAHTWLASCLSLALASPHPLHARARTRAHARTRARTRTRTHTHVHTHTHVCTGSQIHPLGKLRRSDGQRRCARRPHHVTRTEPVWLWQRKGRYERQLRRVVSDGGHLGTRPTQDAMGHRDWRTTALSRGARGQRGHLDTLPGRLSHSDALTGGCTVFSKLVSAEPGSPAPLRATDGSARRVLQPAAGTGAMPTARVSDRHTLVHSMPEPPRPSQLSQPRRTTESEDQRTERQQRAAVSQPKLCPTQKKHPGL